MRGAGVRSIVPTYLWASQGTRCDALRVLACPQWGYVVQNGVGSRAKPVRDTVCDDTVRHTGAINGGYAETGHTPQKLKYTQHGS